VIASTYTYEVWSSLERLPLTEECAAIDASKLRHLALALNQGLHTFNSDLLLSGRKLRASAKKIASAAQALAKELRGLRSLHPSGGLPWHFVEATIDAELAAMASFGRVPQSDLSQFAVSHAYANCEPLLDAIASAAASWPDQRRLVEKPNDESAPRLYFIRTVAPALERQYGKPMLAETLALTTEFFDVGSLTEHSLNEKPLAMPLRPRVKRIP
jgi:hypothetical protein